MNLYIHKSRKIDINNAKDVSSIVDLMNELEDDFDYLVFTDYEGSDSKRFSVALTDREKDETVPFYIDPSITYLAITFTPEQANDIVAYIYQLEADGKIKRAYTIDYIKKNQDRFEYYVSIE